MAKDKLGYGASRKFTHGARDTEKAIGITHTLYTVCASQATTVGVSPSPTGASGKVTSPHHDPRPVALLKWAFDDYAVEEVLPDSLLVGPSSGDRSCSLLLRITSEGVPDPVVERWLRERLPRDVHFHFLTPIDFVSSSVRHVWVRAPTTRADVSHVVGEAQKAHTVAGPIYVSAAIPIAVAADAHTFPVHQLPALRYTVVLRNVVGSLSDVLLPLRHVGDHGFLNYSHIGCHGVGTGQVYEVARHLMRRQYGHVLQHHARTLAEFTPHVRRELPALLDALSDAPATAVPIHPSSKSASESIQQRNSREWRGLAESVRRAARADDEVLHRAKGPTGLYLPHHTLLGDFVERLSTVAPRSGGDTAQMVREGICRRVLLEMMHTVSDVHFNALVSLSMEHVAPRVVTPSTSSPSSPPRLTARVGDLVCTADRTSPSPDTARLLDCYEGAADHVNGFMTSDAHVDWSRLAVDASGTPPPQDAGFKVVRSAAEAAQYALSDVVLPCAGQGWESIGANCPGSSPAWPENATGALFSTLANSLEVGGLAAMKLAPYPRYRPLVVRPGSFAFYLCDKHRGWEWSEGSQGEALKATLYTDLDGIQRVESPFMRLNGHKRLLARSGIRHEDARQVFLKPARKNGMMCVVQATLPRGSPMTSLLREVFQVTTLSPSAIFQLLHKPR